MADSDPITTETPAPDAKAGNIVVLPATEKAQRPSDKVIGFVKRHPALTAAGGLAAGALVVALLPKRMTRGVATKAIGLAETAGASGVLFGKRAAKQLGRMGKTAHHQAHDTLGEIEEKVEEASDYAASKLEKLASAAVVAATAFGQLSRKQAERLGEAAEEGAHKASEMAHDLRRKITR